MHSRPGDDFALVLALRPVLYSRGAPFLGGSHIFSLL